MKKWSWKSFKIQQWTLWTFLVIHPLLFESNGTKISASNYSDQVWVDMRGYEIRFNPHLSTKATIFEPYGGSTQKPCSWYVTFLIIKIVYKIYCI